MMTDTPYPILQPVLDALPGETAILDQDGRIVLVNDAWNARTGDGLMVRGNAGDDFLAGCEPEVARDIRQVLCGERDEHSFDYPFVTGHGVTWFSMRFRAFNDGCSQGVLVTHEASTARTESGVVHSESDLMLNALIEASPLAIIAIDTASSVTRWNRAAERLFGWSAQEVLGEFYPAVPEDQLDEFLANLAVAFRHDEGTSVEARRQRKDGTLVDVRIHHASIHGPDGTLRGAMGIITDITADKRLAEQEQFLSEAASVLSASLDYEQTLAQVVQMAVPRIADYCTVNLLDENGDIRRLAAAHHDPVKNEQLRKLVLPYDIPRDSGWGTPQVLRTGKPEIRQWLDAPGDEESDQLKAIREIGLRSSMSVPLIARERVIGAITLLHGDSGRTYGEDSLPLVQGLADRAASAIDNARLYREARDAEEQFRAIVEHVPAVTYTARADDLADLTFISSQSRLPESMFDNDRVIDGTMWESRLHPDDAERVRAQMEACSASGEPLEVEYRTIFQDGEIVWRLDRASLLRDEAGAALHWQGLVIDITEQKQAETALRTRARQQAAVASLGQRVIGELDVNKVLADAAYTVQATLEIEYVTLALYNRPYDMLEIKATAGISMSGGHSKVVRLDQPSMLAYAFKSASPVIVHDLSSETRFVPWRGMVESGVVSGLSAVIPGPDGPHGVMMAVSTHKRTFTSDDVNFLQAINNLVASALDHGRNEEQVRFQAHLLDVISQAVVATDVEGRITYWNRHAEELYGWRRDEVIGQSALDIIASESTFNVFALYFSELLAGNTWSGDITLKRRDGSTFTGWSVMSPLVGDAGEVTGIVGVSADVTERIQAHAERERLLHALGERVKELTVLHQVAALFESDDQPLDLLLLDLVNMLPAGMQRPELACARLTLGDLWAGSDGYCPPEKSIVATIRHSGGERGLIEVGYPETIGLDVDDLFLQEEQSLIETVADMLAAYLHRIESREKLLRSEARIRAATEGTLDAFGILEPVYDEQGVAVDYRFAEVNSRAEVLLRYTREELLGHTLSELFLPAQAAMFIDAFNQVVATGETVEREVEVPRESDSFWMLFQAVPLEDGVAAFASETTERRRLERQLVHQAFHDALTGLPNRALFLDRVEHARSRVRRRHEGVAVLFLDLDNFKIINDSLGHAAGDLLLVAVAERLSGCIGSGDTAARFGGDEFAILLEDLADWGSVTEMAEVIINAFEEPFTVMGREFYVSPSIGVAIATSSDATASDLLRDADAAMYRAKRNGKARMEVFDPSLSAGMVERFEMENDMRRAIERGEFGLVYQPIIRLDSGEIVALEALVRWNHPHYGVLSPAQFIPIAEETGLIVQIGHAVLEQACADAVEWNCMRQTELAIRVSVNISARQFRHPVLVDQVLSVLRSSGLAADLLYLEITESLMVDDVSHAQQTMGRLREMGVHIAVDDFGTGYSALGSLRQYPMEVVKIDRVFVSGIEANPQAAVMLSGIVDLAHALGLRVVAEGVETPGERDRLRAMGCDLAQGYLFAHPMPIGDLAPLMRESLASVLPVR